ncbi:MAG: hypothetical protein WA001_00975 [Patescibacteria group bacterium]
MPDPTDVQPVPAKPKRKMQFFLFRLSDEELKKQLDGYTTLKPWQSYRRLSSLLIAFSIILTAGLYGLGAIPLLQLLITMAIYGTLSMFIYRGSRVALIITMVVWTLDKILSLGDPTTAIVVIAWWFIYMKVFYGAYQVEVARRKVTA